jgi:thioredoxin reductase
LVLPDEETTSSGDELADYVQCIANLEQLRGRLHFYHEVVALTRERTLKSDYSDDPRRADFPFRLIVRHDGNERVEHADVVIDATGVYASPNPLGNGGAPCPGETSLRSRIDYALPDVTGRDRNRFANRHTLVVGSGHSAASTVRSLGDLFSDYPDTRITWVVRRDVPSHGFPYTLNPDQSSPQRDALHRRANELSLHANVCFCPRTVVDAIEYSNERFRVTLNTQVASGTKRNLEEYDNLVCHTGFRPDRSLWTELQMMEHPATGGPFSLAETILRANRRSGLGLSTGYAEKNVSSTHIELEAPVEEIHAENEVRLLVQNEPNFFVAGIKSYGRDAGFLMQNGFRQVRDVYKIIAGDNNLDLYNGALD